MARKSAAADLMPPKPGAKPRGKMAAQPALRANARTRLYVVAAPKTLALSRRCRWRSVAKQPHEERVNYSVQHHQVVTIALNTGMRKNEILKLTWDRVDFSRGVLQLAETKNGRRREVPMNRAVYDELSNLSGKKEEGPVFRRKDGAAWGDVRTAFEHACRRAKIADFRFHDLRHTCASWLIMRGRSLKEVQEILGHREFSMTLRYAHLSPDRLREAVAALEDFRSASAQKSAQSGKLDPAPLASPRKAGVAQW